MSTQVTPSGTYISRRQFREYGIPTQEPKTIRHWIAEYGFPPPYAFGPRKHRWSLDEIRTWMQSRKAPIKTEPEAA